MSLSFILGTNGVFRFRIPLLFIISGFLYALHDLKPNKQRIKKRFRTLLVSYLVWSAVGILITYLLEILPEGRRMIESSHILQIDDSMELSRSAFPHVHSISTSTASTLPFLFR